MVLILAPYLENSDAISYLLDSIDSLRSQGISHLVSLPQIIVCGDQSSGKSSVLEAISGVPFPVKSNLCTRFPTELVLRKTAHPGVNVSIIPHHSRNEAEKKSLAGFNKALEDFSKLPDLIEAAKSAMGIVTLGNSFSKDLLRIEISGPDRPQLTIVDLPGLIHSENKHQTADDVRLINEVVQSYMKEPRSIILAVVSAKNDYANQIVLKLARKADKYGKRTMGVITKPDTLLPGSDSEEGYVSLAKNQDIEFRLGWHVLRNMDSELGRSSLQHRDSQEATFFASGAWASLPPTSLGIESLRIRLSNVLFRQIAAELPSLMEEIKFKSATYEEALLKLGAPRITLQEQRLYLFQISQSFQGLVTAAIDGSYNDPFFGNAMSTSGFQKRLRAVIQKLGDDFAKEMLEQGHRHKSLLEDNDTEQDDESLSRHELQERVIKFMDRSRGRELPGMFNPMVVAEMFKEESLPWGNIARAHVKRIWIFVSEFIKQLIMHVCDKSSAKAVLDLVIEPRLDEILRAQLTVTARLLKPHQQGHPITYNQLLFERVQRLRAGRRLEVLKGAFDGIFDKDWSKDRNAVSSHVRLQILYDRLSKAEKEPDARTHAASEALDYVRVYYEISRDRFVDDMSVEVIEDSLVAELGKILQPVTIAMMSDESVSKIAGETEESRATREDLQKKLALLSQGIETCRRYAELQLEETDDDDEVVDDASPNNVEDEVTRGPEMSPQVLPSLADSKANHLDQESSDGDADEVNGLKADEEFDARDPEKVDDVADLEESPVEARWNWLKPKSHTQVVPDYTVEEEPVQIDDEPKEESSQDTVDPWAAPLSKKDKKMKAKMEKKKKDKSAASAPYTEQEEKKTEEVRFGSSWGY